jgi:hypothetical protein
MNYISKQAVLDSNNTLEGREEFKTSVTLETLVITLRVKDILIYLGRNQCLWVCPMCNEDDLMTKTKQIVMARTSLKDGLSSQGRFKRLVCPAKYSHRASRCIYNAYIYICI